MHVGGLLHNSFVAVEFFLHTSSGLNDRNDGPISSSKTWICDDFLRCSVANCGVSSGNIGGKTFQVDFWHPLFLVTTWGSKRDPNYSYRSSLFHTLEDDKATLPAQHSPKSNARVDH